MASWTLEQILRFTLGAVQTDGSVYFSLRMGQPFTVGPDGKPKPNTSWVVRFDQNVNANMVLELQAALKKHGFKTDYFLNQTTKVGGFRFNRQRNVDALFRFLEEHIIQPWFIGQKMRNVLIMRHVLKYGKSLTGAELIGLHFSQHKNKTSDLDTPKHKWTRTAVCAALGLSLDQVEKASVPILTKIDAMLFICKIKTKYANN